jgi:hypothetical protein
MKRVALLILLLIGLSWMSSLAEGIFCEENEHEATTMIHDEDAGNEDHHYCHAGTCHFGHCGHLQVRLQISPMDEPSSSGDHASSPYSFILRSAPSSFLLKPPLFIS